MDVVYRLQTVDKTKIDTAEIKPSKIIKATVIWKRDHEYAGTRIEKPKTEEVSEPDTSEFLEELQKAASTQAGK